VTAAVAAANHSPVLLAEVLAHLAPRDGGIYVDATFGAGGYARAILDAADCAVVGIDRDPEACARAADLARGYGGRLRILRGPFGAMVRLLAGIEIGAIDGVAFDLGVSSPQLDTASRGFSFRLDGPLDMRMDPDSGESAADAVNTLAEDELARILSTLGEERAARRIARAVVRARATARIETTLRLAEIVRGVLPPGRERIDPATRTFQALRIYVNDELGELDRGLAAAERLLRPGARLCVVASIPWRTGRSNRSSAPARERSPLPRVTARKRRPRRRRRRPSA
jgi:16S rRNA (cytosine1402-N4)-methyltransferase